MCGIAGFLPRPGHDLSTDLITTLQDALAHRGPDDLGFAVLGRAGVTAGRRYSGPLLTSDPVLIHRRLSILDLEETGWQPMSAGEGRFWLIFNGEIYNFLELREELKALGHRFRGRSDTEVLLAGYAQWGEGVLPRLVGMFAFALADMERRTLLLARDPFGIKPLYCAETPDGVTFASEIKALLHLPGVRRRVDQERLFVYLRQGETDFGGGTLFADVQQLPAAHYLVVSLDGPRLPTPVRYWSLTPQPVSELSFAEAARRLRELFVRSVQLHLRSDVPVGAALSGGIDSSATVMAMREICGARLDLHTFSFIGEGARSDESAWIDLVGGQAGAAMHRVRPSAEELVADLDRLIAAQDEPFGSTSIYAQYRVFGLVRQAGIKVVLDGQGADELLAGYPQYRAARITSLFRQGRLGDIVRMLRSLSRTSDRTALWTLLRAADFALPEAVQGPLRRLVGEEFVPPWLDARWFGGPAKPRSRYTPGSEVLHGELRRTLVEQGLPMLLRYEDRNSMAFSIESRVPFLIPELADFLAGLPEEYLIGPDGTSKRIFRAAMRGLVPDAVLDRTDKIGFATPEQAWLGQLRPWVERVLSDPAAAEIPAIRLPEIRREWEAVVAGRRPFSFRVWRWINLIRWSGGLGVEYTC